MPESITFERMTHDDFDRMKDTLHEIVKTHQLYDIEIGSIEWDALRMAGKVLHRIDRDVYDFGIHHG